MRGLHMCELEGGGDMRGHCWSCHSCPFLYGGSPFWVICFLNKKKMMKALGVSFMKPEKTQTKY